MDAENFDREEIDGLVRELMTKRFDLPKPKPVVSQQPASEPVAPQPPEQRPGGRWSNIRVLMPSMPAPTVASRVGFALPISLPQLPDVRHLISMPGPATVARMWVALAVAYGAAMMYWPYPVTYWLGLVSYLSSVGLALVAGVWGARLSWEARLGAAHTIALCTVAWTLALATAVTLPLIS